MLRAIAPFVALFAAIIVGTDRRIVRLLRRAEAFSGDRAIPVPRAGNPIWRWRIHRMESGGALKRSNGAIYLDPEGWSAYRRRRRLRALVVLAIAVPLAILASSYFR